MRCTGECAGCQRLRSGEGETDRGRSREEDSGRTSLLRVGLTFAEGLAWRSALTASTRRKVSSEGG